MDDDDFDKRFEGMDSEKYKDTPVRTFEDASVTFLQFLEAQGAKGLDPSSTDYLRLQMRYLQTLQDNNHPLDVLRNITLNPWVTPRERISAAKTLLEYTMVKVPSKFEVQGAGGRVQIDPAQLAKLTDDEITTLVALLEKTAKD